MENWRAVVGYEGHYEISDLGRVRSLARVISRVMMDGSIQHQRRPEKILGQSTRGGTWYPRVTLTVDRKRRTISVHTLVLDAFVGPSPDGMECRHFDGDKGNSRLDNIAWATHVENEADKRDHGTMICGEKVKNSALTTNDVIAIRRRYRCGCRQNALAREYAVSNATINRVVKRQSWAHLV